MKCIKCGKTIDDDSRFCHFCGTKQDREVKCDNCGRSIEFNFKYCPECGEEIDWNLKALETEPFEFVNHGDYIELTEPLGDVKMIEIFSQPGDFIGPDNHSFFKFSDAKRYARNLRKGGFTDWRLPTIEELKMIYKKTDCVIMSEEYKEKYSDWKIDASVWSSTIEYDMEFIDFNDIANQYALCVNFKNGKTEKCCVQEQWADIGAVICVRSNYEIDPYSKENFIDRGDYIELRNPVGNIHMIEKGYSSENKEWHEAKRYAENLRKGGFNDWRIPTKQELEFIYKTKEVSGVDKIVDPQEISYSLWSSSSWVENDKAVWFVSFAESGFAKDGEAYVFPRKEAYERVRCVR